MTQLMWSTFPLAAFWLFWCNKQCSRAGSPKTFFIHSLPLLSFLKLMFLEILPHSALFMAPTKNSSWLIKNSSASNQRDENRYLSILSSLASIKAVILFKFLLGCYKKSSFTLLMIEGVAITWHEQIDERTTAVFWSLYYLSNGCIIFAINVILYL